MLEKILEEIIEQLKAEGCIVDNDAGNRAEEIIRGHMNDEENITKFYYCESEDDYYIGQRHQNMYFAKYNDGVWTWFMSRCLPWGHCVVAPHTSWKKYTFPSAPKEIPFTEWFEGFKKKHMNDGWIPVEERLPEDGESVLCTDGKYVYLVEYDADLDAGFGDMDGIIAWKPLPEPYHPEKGEKHVQKQ